MKRERESREISPYNELDLMEYGFNIYPYSRYKATFNLINNKLDKQAIKLRMGSRIVRSLPSTTLLTLWKMWNQTMARIIKNTENPILAHAHHSHLDETECYLN